MNLNSYPDLPDISGKSIVVTFVDGHTERIEAKQSMTISVGVSESFRVAIPAFRVAGVDLPTLEASFKWNESTKYYIRGLQ